LPLLALLLAWLSGRIPRLHDEALRVGLITVAGAAYAGLTALVTWQALRGQSLVRPDAITLTAAGLLLAATVLAAAVVLRRPARRRRSLDDPPVARVGT
jgi:hypothetical protein